MPIVQNCISFVHGFFITNGLRRRVRTVDKKSTHCHSGLTIARRLLQLAELAISNERS